MTFKHGLLALAALKLLAASPAIAQTQAEGTLLTARPAATAANQPRVLVRQIKFNGNTVMSEDALNRLVAGSLGKEVTLADLQNLATKVSEAYHAAGYFLAKAVIPEQDIQGGVVTIRVLEGRLGEIIVTGNQRFGEPDIRKHFDRLVKEKVIRQQTLERALLILNDIPGLEVSSVLQAGKEQGTTDLAVKVTEERRALGSFEFNNFGTRLSSRYRFAPAVDLPNLSGNGDVVNLRLVTGTTPRDLLFGRFNYTRPVNHKGTTISSYFVGGQSEIGEEFAVLGITSEVTSFGFGAHHPLWKSRQKSVSVDAGLDWNDTKQNLLGALTSADKIRKFRAGLSWDAKDNTGRNFASLTWHQGLGSGTFGAMRDNDPLSSRSASGADNRFSKFTLDLARVHRVNNRVYLVGRGSAQLATHALVVGEQLAVGGADSVRGYNQSQFLGDDGVNVSVEARFSPLRKNSDRFQVAVFADHGTVTLKQPTAGQSKTQNITGLGFGVRAVFPREWSLRADLGFHISNKPDTGATALPTIQLIKRF